MAKKIYNKPPLTFQDQIQKKCLFFIPLKQHIYYLLHFFVIILLHI